MAKQLPDVIRKRKRVAKQLILLAKARIADFRAKIAERKAATGKDYLSFYYMEASSYEIAE